MDYEEISKLAEQIFTLCDMAEDAQDGIDILIKDKVYKLVALVERG